MKLPMCLLKHNYILARSHTNSTYTHTQTHTCVLLFFLQLQLALDMLAGNLGSREDQQLASKVVRLVVAGGCIGKRV